MNLCGGLGHRVAIMIGLIGQDGGQVAAMAVTEAAITEAVEVVEAAITEIMEDV